MNINRIISSNIDAILDLEFQKIYEFIEEKYLHYDKCFASEMNQAYDNNTDFFTILDINNIVGKCVKNNVKVDDGKGFKVDDIQECN